MKPKNVAFTYGLVSGIVMAVISAILHVTHLYLNKGLSLLTMLPLIIGVIACCIAYSKANGGYVTFGRVFLSGFIAACIAAAVVTVWTILSFIIWPNMIDEMMEYTRQEVSKSGGGNERQMEMAVSMMGKWMKPLAVLSASLGTLFWGTIFSLIGGAIAKKHGPRPLSEDSLTY